MRIPFRLTKCVPTDLNRNDYDNIISMKKVLIVEDEAPIRKVMSDMLKETHFEVLEAHDGKQGLEIALAEKPDIILLDLLMPFMGGHEMLKVLRKDAWGKAVKVIVLSNQDDAENVSNAYYAGAATEYIIKSNVSLDELKKKVRAAVITAS